MGIRSFIVMALNLESSVNTYSHFVISSLFELVKHQFQSNSSRENGSIRRWDLGASKGADCIAIVKMFEETGKPFTSRNGISESGSEAEGAQLGKRQNREKFCNERRVIISALVKREMKKFISKIRIDRWI